MVQDLSSNITLHTAEKGEVVFNPGEEALQFYIILTGSVGIYTDEKDMVKLYGEKGDHEDLEHDTLGRRVLLLTQGDVFGDKAIMQTGSLRTAAAVANETTELMVMHQQHFQTVFKPALSRHQKDLNVLSALIQLPTAERSPEQLGKMTKILLRVSTFFQNLDPKIQFEVSRVANFRKMDANQTVFRQGAEGDTFYIIIQGKVSIYTQEEPQNQKKSEKEGLAKKSILGKLGLDVNAEYGNFITILSSGKSFGEVSLQQGSDYTSTALTMDPTEFLEIKKGDFDRIVRNQENIELERSVKFLRSFAPMRHLPAQRLIRLALAFHEIEAQKGALLLIQDEKVSNEESLVYVVEKGNVRITRSNPSFDTGMTFKTEMKAKRISGAQDMGKAKSSLIPPEYDLASVGPGEVFGEIAPILGVPQPVTAIATTPVRLHTCTVDEFLKNMQMTDEGLLRRMKTHCQEKEKWIIHREGVNSEAWERYIAHMEHLKVCAKLATHGHQSARANITKKHARKSSLVQNPSFREQKIRSATPLVEKRQTRPLNELPEGFSLSDFSKVTEPPHGTSSPMGASTGALRKGESIVPLEGTMRSTVRDLKVVIPTDDNEDLHRALAVAKRSLHGSRVSTPSLASSPRYNPHLIHKKSPINARIVRNGGEF
jgi:CRP-like cAMP-binding protein